MFSTLFAEKKEIVGACRWLIDETPKERKCEVIAMLLTQIIQGGDDIRGGKDDDSAEEKNAIQFLLDQAKANNLEDQVNNTYVKLMNEKEGQCVLMRLAGCRYSNFFKEIVDSKKETAVEENKFDLISDWISSLQVSEAFSARLLAAYAWPNEQKNLSDIGVLLMLASACKATDRLLSHFMEFVKSDTAKDALFQFSELQEELQEVENSKKKRNFEVLQLTDKKQESNLPFPKHPKSNSSGGYGAYFSMPSPEREETGSSFLPAQNQQQQ